MQFVRKLIWPFAISILLGIENAAAIQAASIDPIGVGATGYIRINGPIESGDFERFEQALKSLQSPTIKLTSPGGVLSDALAIGNEIRRLKLNTYVEYYALCASACGLIWLSGTTKSIEGAGLVGFHSAYNKGGDMTPSPLGNSKVGAYLSQLGYKRELIDYVAQPDPRKMRWLTAGDALVYGIDVNWVDSDRETPNNFLSSKDEIKRELKKDALASAYLTRFPKLFDKIVDAMFDAQARGLNTGSWRDRFRKALSNDPAVAETQDVIFKEASDELANLLLETEFAILQSLAKSDPLFCLARLGLTVDDGPSDYLRHVPAELERKFEGYISRAIMEAPKSVQRLSRRQRQALVSWVQTINRKTQSQFTAKELKRIRSADPLKSAKLMCRYHLAVMMEMMKDRKSMLTFLRHSEELN